MVFAAADVRSRAGVCWCCCSFPFRASLRARKGLSRWLPCSRPSVDGGLGVVDLFFRTFTAGEELAETLGESLMQGTALTFGGFFLLDQALHLGDVGIEAGTFVSFVHGLLLSFSANSPAPPLQKGAGEFALSFSVNQPHPPGHSGHHGFFVVTGMLAEALAGAECISS